jgi:hypothetical protein
LKEDYHSGRVTHLGVPRHKTLARNL